MTVNYLLIYSNTISARTACQLKRDIARKNKRRHSEIYPWTYRGVHPKYRKKKDMNPGDFRKKESSWGVSKGHLNESKHAVSWITNVGPTMTRNQQKDTYPSERIKWRRWRTLGHLSEADVILLPCQRRGAAEDQLAQWSCDLRVQTIKCKQKVT